MSEYRIAQLNLPEMLPTIREAFDNKTLQMFKPGDNAYRACLYAGPCAIGVCLPEEDREIFDNADRTSARSLLNRDSDHHSRFVAAADQQDDIVTLQSKHDRASNTLARDGDGEYYQAEVIKFEEFLVSLEKKYGE